MNLSVIIPSKNVLNLTACVSAVRRCEPGIDVIVVDDGLDLAIIPKDVFVLEGRLPFVYARNVNIGIRAAERNDVVLLNDDALLMNEGGFSLLQRAWRERPEYGIIGAVTNITGQPLQWPQGKGLREVPHIAFVCVFIPRQTIDEVGLLDERYALDYGVEDLDYCEACRRRGLKIGVHDMCYVDHSSLRSTFRGDPRAAKDFSRNKALFDQKWATVPRIGVA